MKKKILLSIVCWIVVVVLIYVLFIPEKFNLTISYLTICFGLTGSILSFYNIRQRKKKK